MNTIVIYNSGTGFTEQYAQWLADELGCPCKPLKKISSAELQKYEQVIFGGWVMGNMVMGLNKIRKMRNLKEPSAIFAVGCTPAYEEVIALIKEQNKLDHTPLFYMEGGLRLDQLGFAQKILLNTIKKSTAKKENRNRQEDFMIQALGTSFDHTSRSQVEPLVEYFRGRK